MSSLNPFSTRVGVSQRSSHLVDLVVRNDQLVSGYRLWVSRNVNDAYGPVDDSGLDAISATGGDMIMEAKSGKLVQSPGIQKRGVASVAEVRRGHTSFFFDPDDYIIPVPPLPSNVPPDNEYSFARIQEKRKTTGWMTVDAGAVKNANMPIRGSILVVPNSGFYSSASSVLSMSGLAPAGSDCVAYSTPVYDLTVQKPMPMHIVFPRPMSSITIRNTSGASTLLVSFAQGQPMVPIAAGGLFSPTGGGYAQPGVTEVILAMSGGGGVGCSFSIDGVVNHQRL